MNSTVFLLSIIIIVLAFPMVANYLSSKKNNENFTSYNINTNYGLGSGAGKFPSSLDDFYLQENFPLRPKPGVLEFDNEQASRMWWHYPIFKEGSYAQITNNIRYPNNPDVATCTPEVMCGSIYGERRNKSNYVYPNPPININCNTRIGYFLTGERKLI
jgi:hypothetical protein